MQVRNGLYSVRFENAGVDYGTGVIAIKNGALNGGDAGFLYQGSFTSVSDAGEIRGRVKVVRWNAAVVSVIPGLNDYQLNLSGQAVDGGILRLKGSMQGAEHIVLMIEAVHRADLVE